MAYVAAAWGFLQGLQYVGEVSGWPVAHRGEVDRALNWLDMTVQHHDPSLGAVSFDPALAELHSDPRWLSFVRKAGMAPDQLAAIKFDVMVPQ